MNNAGTELRVLGLETVDTRQMSFYTLSAGKQQLNTIVKGKSLSRVGLCHPANT